MFVLLMMLFVSGVITDTKSDSFSCPENCHCIDNFGVCDRCKPGWYGNNCRTPCYNCADDGCHRNSGKCLRCHAEYYGDDCKLVCPGNCRVSPNGQKYCIRHSGYCADGCVSGWHGDHCDKTCSRRCKRNTCAIYNGRCTMGCEHGWHGHRCDKPCSAGCINNTCNGDGDCTLGCVEGLYGRSCHYTCPPTCRSSKCKMDLSLGIPRCLDGCNDGWYNINCEFKCNDNCVKCDRISGKCHLCQQGWFGHDCKKACKDECKGNICDMHGICKNGCSDGYHGNRCHQRCDVGCIECDQMNGTCHQCKPGYYGQQCMHECSLCKSRECSVDGHCRKGCVNGFHGSHCEHTCSTNCLACEQLSGRCQKCEAGWSGKRCALVNAEDLKLEVLPGDNGGANIVGNFWMTLVATALSLIIIRAISAAEFCPFDITKFMEEWTRKKPKSIENLEKMFRELASALAETTGVKHGWSPEVKIIRYLASGAEKPRYGDMFKAIDVNIDILRQKNRVPQDVEEILDQWDKYESQKDKFRQLVNHFTLQALEDNVDAILARKEGLSDYDKHRLNQVLEKLTDLVSHKSD